MRFVILHYHIFKNAGSTIEDILDHSFGDRFGMLETPVPDGVVSTDSLLDYVKTRPALQAVSSHQIRYPPPQAPGILFFPICFLRDPLDRLRSFYDYFRQRPNAADPVSNLANAGSLGDFVSGILREYPLFVRNNQVNLIACCGNSDEPEEGDLELAIRRMRATPFLGVVDCFEQSVIAGTTALRPAFPGLDCRRPAVNVSRGLEGTVASRTAELRQACGPELFAELLRVTALDRRLVDWAREEVLRRCEQASPVIPARAVPREPANRARSGGPAGKPGFLAIAKNVLNLIRYRHELRSPEMTALFDEDFYQASGPARLRYPLLHFLLRGAAERRQPHPLFDTAYYLETNPDVAATGLNPLLHYLRHGAAEDRKPNPLFDPRYYRAHRVAAAARGENALVSFLRGGAGEASPHPLFDCQAYLRAHPEAAARGWNPLAHYLRFGRTAAGAVQDGAIPVEIGGVRLSVYCLNEAPGPDTEVPAGAAIVWRDAGGAAHWLAEPQQLPFLRAVDPDQIRAQALRTQPGRVTPRHSR